MNILAQVPPGFRFHPTEEELVDYYLRKKIASRRIDLDVIKDVDLYKIEPWDIQQKCKIGTEEQNEWYFFSHKDKKYPTGTRTNRATNAGFWKATGRDKPIYSKNNLIGMRKTLVFYKGRAPNGQKLDWIMHEYRLETNENGPPQEEGWVACRVFKKKVAAIARASEHESSCWYDDRISLISADVESPKQIRRPQSESAYLHHNLYPCKQELLQVQHYHSSHDHSFLQLPQLESPKLLHYVAHIGGAALLQASVITQEEQEDQFVAAAYDRSVNNEQSEEQVTDWRIFDKLVASQLSHDDLSKGANCSVLTDSAARAFQASEKEEAAFQYASTSSSTNQIDLWK